jgi:hypothetical protein
VCDYRTSPKSVKRDPFDQNAVPTLVEVKRSSDTRIRREVVGQMLDYAANPDASGSTRRRTSRPAAFA